MKRTKVALLMTLLLATGLFAVPWSLPLTLNTAGDDFELTIGVHPDATNSYDTTFDENLPLAPPSGPYGFIANSDTTDPYITMLLTDIRYDDNTEKVWAVNLDRGTIPQTISWNSGLLPTSAGSFYIGAAYPIDTVSVWNDMSSMSELEFYPAQIVYIRFVPSGTTGETPPTISLFTPTDGASDVATTEPLIVKVVDAETGVNRSSIVLIVNSVNVTSEASYTSISGGYRVEYLPSGGWDGVSTYTVYFYAEEIAYDSALSVSETHTFHTATALSPADWEIPLTVWTIDSGDTVSFDISFGEDNDASQLFDVGYDGVIPVAPPGEPYAYFPLSDPMYPAYTMLSRDIHNLYPEEDTWELHLERGGLTSGVSWDTDDVPSAGDFIVEIGTSYPPFYPTDWTDMTTASELTFTSGMVVHIRGRLPTADFPPYLVSVEPSDGATGVAPNTNINIVVEDAETGVDPATVSLTVNGDDVTSACTMTPSGNRLTIFYDPPDNFPEMELVEWNLNCADYSLNYLDASGRFMVGYILTPTWMETLRVVTIPFEGTPYSQVLAFGADEAGTDGFDIGLDAQAPPPPPGSNTYGYFYIDDPLWTQLQRDIRGSSDDDILWTAYVFNVDSSSAAYTLHWGQDYLPSEGDFEAVYVPFGDSASDWTDMRESDSIGITASGTFYIHYLRYGETYCLSGYVYLEGDSADLSGTTVEIPSLDFSTETDSTGYYSICTIPPGTYTIRVSHSGYTTQSPDISITGDTEQDFTLYLRRYSLYGYISLEDTSPTEWAGTVVDINGVIVYTETDGYYILSGLTAGHYPVSISHDGFIPVDTGATIVDADVELSLELAVIPDTGMIFGTITLTEDESSPHTTYIVLDGVDTTYADSTGSYSFDTVPYGEHIIYTYHWGYESVTDTVDLESDMLMKNYELEPLYGVLSGFVWTDTMVAVTGAMVVISPSGDTAYTDDDGYYYFDGVRWGDYTAYVSVDGYNTEDSSITFATTDTYTLDFFLTPIIYELNPPRNLHAINGLHNRFALRWDPPDSTAAHLLGYYVVAYNPLGSDDTLLFIPEWSTGHITRNVALGSRYVVAVYEEGLSDRSNIVVGYSGDNPTQPDILFFDFDNGATLADDGSRDERDIVNPILNPFGLLADFTDQDGNLNDYDELLNYQVIWITTGIDDALNTKIRGRDIKRLMDFLGAGGSIYWEGADIGYDYSLTGNPIQKEFFDLLGIRYVSDGRTTTTGNVNELFGDESFFQQGALHLSYDYHGSADQRIDELGAGDTLVAAMIMHSQNDPAPDSTNGRMFAYQDATLDYRTVASSVYLGGMHNGNGINHRWMVFAWIFNFLTDSNLNDVIELPSAKPSSLALASFPNPFNASCAVEFAVASDGAVRLDVTDISGHIVRTLVSDNMRAGSYIVRFDGKDLSGASLPSGTYLLTLQNGAATSTSHILLMK